MELIITTWQRVDYTLLITKHYLFNSTFIVPWVMCLCLAEYILMRNNNSYATVVSSLKIVFLIRLLRMFSVLLQYDIP